jgi:hypothetical protein
MPGIKMFENMEHDSLIVSESSLAYIPKNKFNCGSWSILDRFMDYATDVFTVTFESLIKNGYLRIENKEVKTFKIFGIVVWTRVSYSIRLVRSPSEKNLLGWLEGMIFEQFKYTNLNNLDEIVYSVLNIIFDKDHQLTNPGKIFTLQILKHQRINFYKFNQVRGWTNSVTVWRSENANYQFKLGLLNISEYRLEGIERYQLRRIINAQFNKFQDLG